MKTLKNTLLINAVSSGITGVALVVLAPWVAALFQVSIQAAFVGVGAFLVVFAAYVFVAGISKAIHPKRVRFIIALDVLWVVASMAIVLSGVFELSVIGKVLITGVALWVAAMAYFQRKGLKSLQPE